MVAEVVTVTSFTILAMSDKEYAETPVAVASQASQVMPLSQTKMNHPPLPQVNHPIL